MADVEGMDDLLRALAETSLCLGDRRKVIAKALRNGGKKIEEPWKASLPVRTGKAKRSVRTSVINQTADSAEARVGATGPGFVLKFDEFGTVHQAPRPKLGPAFDRHQDEAVEEIGKTIGDGIGQAYG